MKKGTLLVFKSKRGKIIGKIEFTKDNGQIGQIPVTGLDLNDTSLDGKPCEFARDKGRLMRLVVDGKVLYGEEYKKEPKVKYSGNNKNQSNKNFDRKSSNKMADSLDIRKAFVPNDVQELASNINHHGIDNFALKLNKAARYDERMKKFQFTKRERKGENYQIKPDYGNFDFKQLSQRQLRNTECIFGKSNTYSLELVLNWRMAQGLGLESIYETSITLHHVYGIPYIPSSALKGIVRSWIINNIEKWQKGDNENSEGIALSQSKIFCDWFGCPDKTKLETLELDNKGKRVKKEYNSYYKDAKAGQIIFTDAFPTTFPNIEPDVMNPHYQPYYGDNSNKKPPTDYYKPIPVFFLTVTDCSFQFIIGSNNKELLTRELGGKTIFGWLKDALQNHGIGAKTAVGYGYMTSK